MHNFATNQSLLTTFIIYVQKVPPLMITFAALLKTNLMWRKFCGWILKVWGWETSPFLPPEPKCILLGVPHTSMLDFVVAYLFYVSIGGKTFCMVKKSLFFPPLGWILRAIGGIPVDRKHPSSVVRSVIREMEKTDLMHLAIAPEGTRKPIARWKTGYHFIAKAANIPVYLCYFDWGRKKVAVDRKVELTDDANADTRRIQEIYESMNLKGRHPQNYITG